MMPSGTRTGVFSGPLPSVSGTEGEGFTHARTGIFDIGDRFRMGRIFFPGTTATHTLVRPDAAQAKIMKDKYKGTPDYNPFDNAQRHQLEQYDAQPEVIKRRWESMSMWQKLQNLDTAADVGFWAWNGGMVFFLTRLMSTNMRAAIKWGIATMVGVGIYQQHITAFF